MSHVDEGALHAYLDGALDEYPAAEAQTVREHLDACAACRERLESEREIRSEAASILGLAAPEVTVPSLEELRAYVRANAARRSPVSVRLYRLSWAASVVLALGTGWMLRGGQVPVTSTEMRLNQISPQEASASFDDAESDAAELEPSAEEVSAGAAGQVTPAVQPAPTRAAEAARQEASFAAPSAVAANQSAVAAPSDLSPVTGGARALTADDSPASPDNTADLDVTASLEDNIGRLDEVVVTGPDPSRARVQAAPALDAVTAGPLAEREKVADAIDAGATTEPERRTAPTDIVTSANAAGPAAGVAGLGRSIEFRDARDEVDEQVAEQFAEQGESYSLVVPSLDVLDVRFRGRGVRPEGQVVLQRLESGDTLEVIHLPPEIDPSSLEDPAPGDTELRVQRTAGWIVMRAPLREEALKELLDQLLAGR